MAKRPHNFGVINGGGNRTIGGVFDKSSKPELVLIPAEPFTNVKQVLHEMGNAFIDAHNAKMRVFAVLYCSHDNSFTYASSNNEDSFIPYAIGSDDTPLKLKALLYTDRPFEQQLPVKYTNNAQSIDDILRALEQIAEDNNENNPYGELPDLHKDTEDSLRLILEANTSTPPPRYCEKIQRIKKLFDEQKETGTSPYLYVRLTENNGVLPITLPDIYQADDANNFIRQLHPNDRIIMSLHLFGDFDEQIGSGNFDPYNLKSWESLRETPLDCLKPIKLIEQQRERAPTILGPKGPSLIVDNSANKAHKPHPVSP